MESTEPVTIPALQQMKRDGKRSVGVVAWDYQIARIAERAGVDFVSVGDSVGVNLWGQANPLEVIGRIRQNRQQRLRFARDLHFPHDPACVIHNADTCFLD